MKLPGFLTSLPTTKTLLYVIVALVAANTGQFLYARVQAQSLQTITAEKALVESHLQVAQAANRQNDQTVKELLAANFQWGEAARQAEADRASALATAAKIGQTLQSLRDAAKNQTLDGPSCEQIRNADLGGACPLLIERLRNISKTDR